MMDLKDLIEKKKQGLELSSGEIHDWIQGMVHREFPEYQVAALLMAIRFQGLSFEETVSLTREMSRTGTAVARTPGVKRIGKHSTGGVGDKISFLVGPLVASYGVQVPFMSGRGLGHTGGTIDKLSGIPGIQTALTPARVEKILKQAGFCFFEQTRHLGPVDQKLYALRDATGTVDSLPLIVSSILSKKIQEGLDGLVLDVKFGLGSLLGSLSQARKSAKVLLKVAGELKCKATAVLSWMDQPLGHCVGNNLEMIGSLETLRGLGTPNQVKLVVILAHEMLKMALAPAKVPTPKDLQDRLTKGQLVGKLLEGLKAQGGKERDVLNLPSARNVLSILSPRSGFIRQIHARAVGEAAMHLGAGRMKMGDPIDATVGIRFLKKVGAPVKKNEILARVYFNKRAGLAQVQDRMKEALQIAPQRPRAKTLIAGILKNY